MSTSPTPAPRPTSDAVAKQLQAKALANLHRETLRRRARRIRRTVISSALALFTAAFVGIYVQMASGHDPALSAAARRGAVSTSLTSTTASSTTASSTGGESSSSGESSTAASSVTTSQS